MPETREIVVQWMWDVMERAEEADDFPCPYQNWLAAKRVLMAMAPFCWPGYRGTMQATEEESEG